MWGWQAGNLWEYVVCELNQYRVGATENRRFKPTGPLVPRRPWARESAVRGRLEVGTAVPPEPNRSLAPWS